jgi:hypothetical protein
MLLRKISFSLVLLIGCIALATAQRRPIPEGKNYSVGSVRKIKTLEQLLNSVTLKAGDTVDVDEGTYVTHGVDGIIFDDDGSVDARIVIRKNPSAKSRPIIKGGNDIIRFKGNHYVFEGFDLAGSPENKRGIFSEANDIIVRDIVLHDVTKGHGILTADNYSGSFTLEYSEIYNCGDGTYKHPLYAQTDEITYPGSTFTMRYCYMHDQNGGNGVKIRAERARIYYNWFEGGFFRELELIGPDPFTQFPGFSEDILREDGDVVGNVFVHTQNKSFGAIRCGGDRTGQSKGMARFVNNTFIMKEGAMVFQLFDSLLSIELHNNIFYKVGGGSFKVVDDSECDWKKGRQIHGSNNWIAHGGTIPDGLRNTLTGTDPGFVNSEQSDFHLKSSSPLVNAGDTKTSELWYPFVTLFPPKQEPPLRKVIPVDQEEGRVISGAAIDLGAYEYYETPPCPFTIYPASASYIAVGGGGVIHVKTGKNCTRKAISNADWIKIVGGEGEGPGWIRYVLEPNPEGQRIGTITVGSETFTICQERKR